MNQGGWVASDATEYSLQDRRPDWHSLVSVAISVHNIQDFNQEYSEIIEEKADVHGINIRYPIIKNEDLNRWCPDWDRKAIRRDIVTELLDISEIATIQITETSLHSKWVDVFKGEENNKRRIRSEDFIEQYLQPYYNLVSIWEYLRNDDSRPNTYYNVMTDDFSGKISPAWLQIGQMADELNVIPKGDQTYPLLSMADLVMELVKQEVDDWHERQIYEYLRSVTPDDSAYIDSDAINAEDDLKMIAPVTNHNVNTNLHYPHPIVFIDTGSVGSSSLTSLDLYRHALHYAKVNNGCVKMFNENQDRDYLDANDILICLDGNSTDYSYLTEYNDQKAPILMTAEESIEFFHDEIGAFPDTVDS